MFRLMLACALLFGMMLTATGAATAQETASDVDVAAIGETVLAADPEALATGLETPPDDADLPEGFINPTSDNSLTADITADLTTTTQSIVDVDGVIDSVSHGFETDPSVVPGLLSAGLITFVIADREVTSADLDQIESRANQGINATPAAGVATPEVVSEGNVQRIDVGGVDSVVLTVEADLDVVVGVVQIVIVPVGNTLVIGTLLSADQGEVDRDAVLGFAEELSLAGATHVGTIAEGV